MTNVHEHLGYLSDSNQEDHMVWRDEGGWYHTFCGISCTNDGTWTHSSGIPRSYVCRDCKDTYRRERNPMAPSHMARHTESVVDNMRDASRSPCWLRVALAVVAGLIVFGVAALGLASCGGLS